jgi:phosphoribosylformylglycinamidine synthase
MSGSYSYEEDETGKNINIDVPSTLISFAVGTSDAEIIVSNEFKKSSSYIYFLKPYYKEDNTIDFEDLKNLYAYVTGLIEKKVIISAYAVGFGGIGEAIFKMCVGNGIGFNFEENISQNKLFSSFYGSFIVETTDKLPNGELLGRTTSVPNISINNNILSINELTNKWLSPLEDVFPTELTKVNEDVKIEIPSISYYLRPKPLSNITVSQGFAKPTAFIPVFPGTTYEYDIEKQFEEAGASVDISVFRNLDASIITESIDILANKIRNAQILMFPGSYSGGDEPGGSGKFITAIFRNPKIIDAVNDLLNTRNGLILGISNGFQILLKLGLLPYGEIQEETVPENDITLSINRIGRHQSYVAYTRVASVNSPWFSGINVGDVYAVPICHGEGRFCISDEQLQELINNGQIATQYADINGNPTMHPYYNPNASVYAVEGIFSPDGRIFGKMGHSERIGKYVLKNISANTDQKIFASGVKYFK